MGVPKIITSVVSEQRSDIAHRAIALLDAPRLTYTHTRYRFWSEGLPTSEERTWQPQLLHIKWSQGNLVSFRLTGHRIRKDGTVGRISESISYTLSRERGAWVGREGYDQPEEPAPDWVLQLVECHKDNVPPFDADR